MSKHLFSSSLFAFAILTLALPAAAADISVSTQVKSVTVAFGDLNTSSKKGAQALFKRIVAAAETVCGSRPRITDIVASESYEACVSETIARAVADAGLPMLTLAFKGDDTTTLAQQ